MFYRWTRIISGVGLVIFLSGSISASRSDPAYALVSKSNKNSFSPLEVTPSPPANSAPNLLFLPVTTNLGLRPPIEFIKIQTEDGADQPKSIFLPGEDITYRIELANNTNTTKSVTLSWIETNSCGVSRIIDGTVRIRPGKWERLISATAPDCQGIANHVIEAVYGNETLEHSFEHIITTPFQGFDKCTLPTVTQMQTWWNSSPYWTFNVYVGGVSLACRDSNLNADWLRRVSQQGWTFIPTWVGPQAPCTGFNHRMSANPSTARQQGRNEADAAAAAVTRLGLLGNRIIYYDLEGYSSKATDACRQAVAAFIQGWVERLHELGFNAGVYGGACSSFAADWAGNTSPPDDVWLAHWYRSSWYKYASVWNTPCVANELWANHQRLKQYAGDHNETWGGVTFRIDSSVLDGTVASFQEMQEYQTPRSISPGLDLDFGGESHSDSIEAMQLLAPGKGWVIVNNHLYVTESNGETWQDITPAPLLEGELLGVFFNDPALGWVVGFTSGLTGQVEMIVLRTEDGGKSWAAIASPLTPQEIHSIAAAYPHFLDAQRGWIALKIQSSSNFSLGRLFATQDGGNTWEELSLLVGEPVRFVNANLGWVAGGPRGDQLLRTEDGGHTWQLQALATIPESSIHQIFIGLPDFSADQGLLPVIVSALDDSELKLFATHDGGRTWEFSQSVNLDSPSNFPAPFSLDDKGHWWVAIPGRPGLLTNSFDGSVDILVTPELTGNLIALDFINDRVGWGITQEGNCSGSKPKLEDLVSIHISFFCRSTSILWSTEDAGRTWRQLFPVP